jgi:TRAP-type transport system periplasmic protein
MASLTKPGAICAFLSAVRRFCPALALFLVVALAVGSAAPAFAEDKEVDLRLSLWVPPAHPLTSAAKAWGEDIAKASGGTIKITVFPSEQLGKAFDHYDMARDDIADITYVNPGYQPGRFPIIAIGQMPFMFGDARKGTAALDSWYRKYAPTEMKDTHFCFAFIHDPGALHSTRKRIVMPEDLRGVKVRPAQSTIAELVTRLGGTNVQASAPEAREVLERGVADAITFPWGSLYLFGIDKVVKHHMDAPLYTTVFTFSMNKDKYDSMSPAQKKVMDDHCSTDWAVKIAGPWGDFEAAGRDKMRADPAHHDVYKLTPDRMAAWRATVKPLEASWATAVKQAGADPDAALGELKASIAKYGAGP